MTRTAEPTTVPAGRPPAEAAEDSAEREPESDREKMTLERAQRTAVLTAEDVGDLIGLNAFTIYRNKNIPGRLPGIGRAVRFSTKVVLAWINGEAGASKPTRAR
jgi:hypothetical protein